MKKSAKDRVFDELIRLTGNKSSITAEKISKNLGISRQNASHYLTRLVAVSYYTSDAADEVG
ncbi:hypothetical protein KQJ29_36020, partial [Enterococcus sp. S181_ASV_20]|nr:hypothetical protein [Enterococcus sp. S181_ASV_20]